MFFISHGNGSLYSGDKANWQDIETTSERPSPNHTPIVEDGVHVGWEVDKESQRREYQQQRDQAMLNMTHELSDGSVVQVRPQDIINFQTGIQLGETQDWVLADNSVRELTVAEMQECLQSGMIQGKAIWDNYTSQLKAMS